MNFSRLFAVIAGLNVFLALILAKAGNQCLLDSTPANVKLWEPLGKAGGLP